MKMSIPRRELKEAVTGFSKIIAGKSTLPILSALRLESDGAKVVAHGTDLDQKAEYTFTGAQSDGAGVFVTDFQNIKNLSRGADSDAVEFAASGVDTLTVENPIAGSVVSQTLATHDPGDWPSQLVTVETAPVEGFTDTFRRLMPFAATDETRLQLVSCFLDVSDTGEHKSKMIATDGRRLTLQNSMTLPLTHSCTVPTTKFLAWPRLGESRIGVACPGEIEWFALDAGPWRYYVRTRQGTYPNYRQVIPVEPGKNVIRFLDADAVGLPNLLSAIPAAREGTIVLRPGKSGELTVSGVVSGGGLASAVVLKGGSTFGGDAPCIGVNGFYLLDALKAGFREFFFEDEFSPLLSDNGSGGKHVLMPIRVAEAGAPASTVVQAVTEAAQAAEAETAVPDVAAVASSTEKSVEQGVVETPAQTTGTQDKNIKHTKGESMPEKKNAETALEKLQAAYEVAKDKVREAGAALVELSGLIKDVAREDKARRNEVENVRSSLAKIQAIKV